LTTTGLYCILCIISIVIHKMPHTSFQEKLPLIDLIIDIIVITLLVHLSKSFSNHLIILLVVTITASGILLQGRMSTFMAAIATMAMLFEQSFSLLIESGNYDKSNWLSTGILGAVFFTVSLLTQRLASRLRDSENYALTAAQDLIEMQKLNHYIIQRMRTGVMVIDNCSRIRLLNASATELLHLNEQCINSKLETLCPTLYSRLKDWQDNPSGVVKNFQSEESDVEIQANFANLLRSQTEQIIIFLDDASRLAHQAQQLKLASLGQLTAAIAHEVRNPLGAISHAAQLLLESDQLQSEELQMADIIEKHCIRVNDIIENILQLSRRHAATLQRINLKEWCDKFISEFLKASPEKNIINTEELKSVWVQIDTSQLNQILTNLFENGLRYSEKQTGHRTLHVSSGHLTHSELPYLDITDDGPGISESQQKRLFEPFYTSEPTGTGLGLYIARELCQMNHANLVFMNKQKNGACFRITFAHPNRILAP